METDIVFTEHQKFRQWYLWLFFYGLNALTAYGLYRQYFEGVPFGDHPMSTTGLVIVLGFQIALTIFFSLMHLDMQVRRSGIAVRFFPFKRSYRLYPWEEIQASYVTCYSPLAEYGGWGIRGYGKKRALNVSGNQGLQLVFTNGKRLLIGTIKPIALKEALKQIDKDQPET